MIVLANFKLVSLAVFFRRKVDFCRFWTGFGVLAGAAAGLGFSEIWLSFRLARLAWSRLRLPISVPPFPLPVSNFINLHGSFSGLNLIFCVGNILLLRVIQLDLRYQSWMFLT